MTFTDLPTELQDIYMSNLELGLKVILFIFIGFLCYKGIQNFHNPKKTPYLLVSLYRFFMGITSYIFLILMPLALIFIFNPLYPFEKIQMYVLSAYFVLMVLGTIFILVNIYFYTPAIILRFTGFDPYADRSNEVLNRFSKVLGLANFKKNQMINKIFNKK